MTDLFAYENPENFALLYSIAEKKSLLDPLTGLLNREGFELKSRQAFEAAKRTGADLGLAMIDANKFKNINDAYGHPKGDEVLQAISDALKKRFRKSDIIARYGGDEFVVLLVGYHGDEPKMTDEINKLIREKVSGVDPHELGVAIGIHSWDHNESYEKLISNADKEMYDKKNPRRKRDYVPE